MEEIFPELIQVLHNIYPKSIQQYFKFSLKFHRISSQVLKSTPRWFIKTHPNFLTFFLNFTQISSCLPTFSKTIQYFWGLYSLFPSTVILKINAYAENLTYGKIKFSNMALPHPNPFQFNNHSSKKYPNESCRIQRKVKIFKHMGAYSRLINYRLWGI